MTNFYHDVFARDNPSDKPYGWVQWKGTDVCIDLHCVCGYHGHFDGAFLYHYRCPACGAHYALGAVVKLIPLTPPQVAYVESQCGGFKTVEPEAA